MARVTRSKKFAINEDQSATSVPDQVPEEPFHSAPFHELPVNNTMPPLQETIAAELKGLKAAYRTAIGGGRKGSKRTRKQRTNTLDEDQDVPEAIASAADVEITVPISAPSTANPISLEATNLTSQDEPATAAPPSIRRPTRRQAAKAQAEPQLPPSNEHITANTQAIELDEEVGSISKDTSPNVSKTPESTRPVLEAETVTKASRADSPVKTLDEVERNAPLEQSAMTWDKEDDSFVDKIITRSPAKPISRIEDSVEALDELEEALEALDAATLAEKLASPQKTREQARQTVHSDLPAGKALLDKKAASTSKSSQTPLQRAPTFKSGFSSVRIKSTAPYAPALKKSASMSFRERSSNKARLESPSASVPANANTSSKRPTSLIANNAKAENITQAKPLQQPVRKRPVSLLQPKETLKSSKPPTRSTFELPGEAVARRLKEQREARLARRDANELIPPSSRAVSGPRIKSTKVPTVSNFELPGEALSRKRREAHEAKMKAQEEEEKRRREFKARPPPTETVPSFKPRDTVASRARQSRIGLEDVEGGTAKRNSVILNVGTQRPSLAILTASNTSAPRAPGALPELTRKPSSISVNGSNGSGKVVQRTVSASEVQVQRQRGKEIYNRDVKLTEEIERERREREWAAKKAREEAAERGRQASREWAEKQFARKMAESRSSSSGVNSAKPGTQR